MRTATTPAREVPGDVIRRLRLEHGMTQDQFGRAVDCTQAAVSHWENGRKLPSPLTARNIERRFGHPDNDLVNLVLEEFERRQNGGGQGPRTGMAGSWSGRARRPLSVRPVLRFRRLTTNGTTRRPNALGPPGARRVDATRNEGGTLERHVCCFGTAAA